MLSLRFCIVGSSVSTAEIFVASRKEEGGMDSRLEDEFVATWNLKCFMRSVWRVSFHILSYFINPLSYLSPIVSHHHDSS